MPITRACAALALLATAACATAPAIRPGAEYVAMGSSFAAGPGIPEYVDATPSPCFRSKMNYANQLAHRLDLNLIDVSCSGATTRHLTGPRSVPQGAEIPPQLAALSPETKLVTITIGGNDLGYIGRLTTASCAGLMQQTGVAANCAPVPPVPSEETYAALAAQMDAIAKNVRTRSPDARLIFVDYLAVLPDDRACAATPLNPADADADREIARRLAAITAQAARDNGADIIKASDLSKDHHACSPDPWMNGYPRPEAPVDGALYHPNAKGMTAVADALERVLQR